MKADNMFKKLGYTKQYENEDIYYYKDIECKDSYIVFYTGRKLYSKVECYYDAGDFTMEELEAVYRKCIEMEWI